MSEDHQAAARISVENCSPDCSCQSVHILLHDSDGDILAIASMSPALARTIGKEILDGADTAEARQLKAEGRLS